MNNNLRLFNKQVALGMSSGTVVVFVLTVSKWLHIFNFDGPLEWVLPVVGLLTSLTPILLWLLKVPDTFLKYYMSIAMSVFIGILGCFNGIGIYITFALVPIASCLYFDKAYTLFCSFFSYFVMAFAVYVNSAGKMEITYYGWTHFQTFRAYMIGFTLEYCVVSIFVIQVIKRADSLLDDQKQSFFLQRAQDAKYKLLVKETKDIVFEYYPKESRFEANRSIYQKPDEPNKPVLYENFINELSRFPGVQEMYNRVTAGFLEEKFEEFEADLSYTLNGEKVPLWFYVECFVVKDKDKPVSVIGKMHDITRAKEAQANQRRERLESMNQDSKRQNSIYQQVMAESEHFTENDFEKLADGHRFLAHILEEVKYVDDLSEGVSNILASLGDFFGLDRICVVESDASSGTSVASYQWNRNEENRLPDMFSNMRQEDVEKTLEAYDRYGYFEINPTKKVFPASGEVIELEDENVKKVILGNQLWIPMLSNGKYIGAISFDRYDITLYTAVEKFLMSEAVNSLSNILMKISAENANRAKSDFLSTMSHEIRTPMNAIVGMTEVALREDMPESVKGNLMMVKSSAFGLLTLINDILDYSKIEAGRFDIVPEKFSILSILNDVKEMALARNEGKLNIIFNVPNDLPTVLYADSVRIKQVMINYCTNAIKYSDKGNVLVTCTIDKKSEKKAVLHFAVKDNGIGIKKEDLSKLFKSYTRVDTTVNHHKEGTGLGLAICRQLVELMGGNVSVESEYGEGSTFSFTIPVEVADWTPAGPLSEFKYKDESSENEDDTVLAPEARVLIVDDNKVNLMVAKALMKTTGVQIDTAESGKEALRLIEQTDYDIVFMDHFMPEMDGVEATRKIRELPDAKYRTMPIVALTADAMSGVKEELLGCGMNDFLTKPIIVKDLYGVLRRWIPKDKIRQ